VELVEAFQRAVQERDLAYLEEHLGPAFVLTTGRQGALSS
jgi:hypothetical protein